jgi:quercetin dioxygenase-like cupin family protein
MNNFLRLGENVDVMPLLLTLKQKPYLWDQNRLRTTHENTPHAQVSDIWLRFNDIKKFQNGGEDPSILDQHESVCYPPWYDLPEAQNLVHNLNAFVKGFRIGRVMITKLQPGGRITPHVDSGDHASYYERFHIVVQSGPGCLFKGDDETVHMKTGEVWWFQNKSMHEVINNSKVERIHLIVDIHTGRGSL